MTTTVNNWPKLLVALVAIIAVSVLMGVGAITSGEGMPAITLVLGYMLGNGIAAVRGDPVQPIIGRTHDLPPPR